MLLAVDVGNTHVKFAIFDGKEIVTSFRIKTDTTKTSDELMVIVAALFENSGTDVTDIEDVVISSVVPNIMHALNNCVIKMFDKKAMVIGPGTRTGIKLKRTNPAEVGADRIVDGVAALALYGGPIIVADYGTATKFDFFTEDGTFEGAVTCPGVMLSARALWSGTAKLPEVEIVKPKTILAQNTMESMQAGIIYGKLGEAECIIDKIAEEYGCGPIKAVATGGLASVIFPETDRIQYLEPDLTMHGLRILYEKNKK